MYNILYLIERAFCRVVEYILIPRADQINEDNTNIFLAFENF